MSTETEREAVSESLCDCGSPGFHELSCAYLDALMVEKLADGDIIVLPDVDGEA